MIRVSFDQNDDEPFQDDGFQPSLFGGPGAVSVLRQRPLFDGGMDRGPAPASPAREDQPELFPESEEPCGSWFEADVPRRYSRETLRRVARSPLQ